VALGDTAPLDTAAALARPLRRDAAQNRERLLDAAARVFAARGLDASVEEIARVAGLGMGTLYRRFPTKEALVGELVRQQLLDVVEAGQTAGSLPAGKGLERFLWRTGELMAARIGCLARLWTEAGTAELLERLRALVGALLDDAQRHGRIRDDVDVADISLLLHGLNGVIATCQPIAPGIWRRSLELSIAGLRPGPAPLSSPPISRWEMEAISHRPR